jgi:hypothetical protein
VHDVPVPVLCVSPHSFVQNKRQRANNALERNRNSLNGETMNPTLISLSTTSTSTSTSSTVPRPALAFPFFPAPDAAAAAADDDDAGASSSTPCNNLLAT